jgi:hypothetical protein
MIIMVMLLRYCHESPGYILDVKSAAGKVELMSASTAFIVVRIQAQ